MINNYQHFFWGALLTGILISCNNSIQTQLISEKNNVAKDTAFVNRNKTTEEKEFRRKQLIYHGCFQSQLLQDSIFIGDTDSKRKKISNSLYNKLNAKEHFIHAISYPEWYYQSCSMFQQIDSLAFRIPGYFPMGGEGFRMSTRQISALFLNRDSTFQYMQECIQESSFISSDYLQLIAQMEGYEMIPALHEYLRTQRTYQDSYIYTTLCLLMRTHYNRFIQTPIYQRLYPKNDQEEFIMNYRDPSYIPFTRENSQLILDLSMAYYKWRKTNPIVFETIPGGSYTLGEKDHSINPSRKVTLKPFRISKYEVTNAQFQEFVKSTGYITLAEKNKDAMVFRVGLDEFEWIPDTTANWRFPNGKSQGGIEQKMNHPVTCIAYPDAKAYCNWAKVRLPSIEEWEVASGFFKSDFIDDDPERIYLYANIWHGKNHRDVASDETFITTSPVGYFLPYKHHVYDMFGNVFEFCDNTPVAFKDFKNVAATRGGSWWCSPNACGFFNSTDIGRIQKDASFSNVGFRVVEG